MVSATETENRPLIPIRTVVMCMVPADNYSERQPSHKATLYCPNCNHESRINGDWLIQIYSAYTDYECPECGVTIESRPDTSAVIT